MESLDLRRLGQSRPTGSKTELRFCCPNCADTEFKLYVNLKKQVYNCFRCGFKGRLKELKHFTPTEASTLTSEAPEAKKQPSGIRLPLDGLSIGQKMACDYWLKRGFTLEDANHYGIAAYPAHDCLSIPVHTETGEFRFYQDRRLHAVGGMKYVFPKGIKISEFLFNSHRAKGHPRVVLVEGVMDSMAIGDRCMCIFGKQLHDAQIDILRRNGHREVLVWLDPDAKAEAFKAQNRLLPFFEVEMVTCDDRTVKDANDYLIKHGSAKLLSMLDLPDKGY